MKDSPFDLLKQIEVLIIEIFSILILYPKTFLTVLLRPRELTSISDKEFEKPINERFDAYSSPMVYWLLTLLPFAYCSYSLSRRMKGIGKFFVGLFFTVIDLAGAPSSSVILTRS